MRPSLGHALVAANGLVSANALPCDVYASYNTPCVAAHSTTRALFSSFNGPLYRVQRTSDNTSLDIATIQQGGVANSASQDAFCGSGCYITVVYDQSPNRNHLTPAPQGPGGKGRGPGKVDLLANATAAPIHLGGSKVYGIYIEQFVGYRILNSTGVARGSQSEGMYGVFDGTHYNDNCCFDYGNAENPPGDTGNGHMEAINFSNRTGPGRGAGNGPWVGADLENGIWRSGGPAGTRNLNDTSIPYRFVTAMLKGDGNNTDFFALRGGDATQGSLATYYAGPRPKGNPQEHKPGWFPPLLNGSIVLGVGGDNSNGGVGTFYEGAMTIGLPSDACENAVQASIVRAKYNVAT